jgi:mannitol-specific phosphotransferase system IIBC component
VNITVVNSAVSEIPADADIVVTQKTLTDRAIAVQSERRAHLDRQLPEEPEVR